MLTSFFASTAQEIHVDLSIFQKSLIMGSFQRFFRLLLVIALILGMFGLSPDTHAQRSGRADKYFEESGNLTGRLWYGGGFNLALAGSGDYNQFVFGLAPMVGYKITEDFSVGPRFGFDYQYVRGNAAVYNPNLATGQFLGFTNEKKSTFSLSGGIFARYKAYRSFFAHVEFELQNRELFLEDRGLLIYETAPGELLTIQETRENFYAGLGYTSGYPLGFEMLLLYNFNTPENTIELPFDLRFGINYNF